MHKKVDMMRAARTKLSIAYGYLSHRQAAKITGLSRTSIREMMKGKRWPALPNTTTELQELIWWETQNENA